MRALALILLAQVQFMQDGVKVNAPAVRVNCTSNVTCTPLGANGITLRAADGYDGGKVGEAWAADAAVYAQTATTADTASYSSETGQLATNPTDCEPGKFATAIDKSGNLTCSTPSSGAGNFVEWTVDLDGAGFFAATVTSQTWVTSSSIVVCSVFGTTADGLTPEAVAIAGLVVSVSDLVAGTGFNINIYSPYGLSGTVRVHCTGA